MKKAFEPLREHDREDLFGLLYRATSIQATRIQVRKTWHARVEPDSRLSTLQTQLEAQRQQCDAKRRAVYQASEENLEQMEREIVFRQSNVLNLQGEYQVFVRAWNRRDKTSTDPEARTQLFLNEIRKIPKTRLYQGERVRNHVWEFFNANQNEVELAIRSQLREKAELERIPYLIFSRLLKAISRPPTIEIQHSISRF